jgi:tripartite-type tricarboxylate transporter receptor subunit TctC
MLRLTLLAVLIFASVVPAAAEYPERPLTIIVGYPASGMVDIVARPMAESMKKKFPKGVAVLNRPAGVARSVSPRPSSRSPTATRSSSPRTPRS